MGAKKTAQFFCRLRLKLHGACDWNPNGPVAPAISECLRRETGCLLRRLSGRQRTLVVLTPNRPADLWSLYDHDF